MWEGDIPMWDFVTPVLGFKVGNCYFFSEQVHHWVLQVLIYTIVFPCVSVLIMGSWNRVFEDFGRENGPPTHGSLIL